MIKYLLTAMILLSCSNESSTREYRCRDIKTGAIEFFYLSESYQVGDTVEHYDDLYEITESTKP